MATSTPATPLAANPETGSSLRKLVASGSLMGTDAVAATIRLSGKARPAVLYVGAATYDSLLHREVQTFFFRLRGCRVDSLSITSRLPSVDKMRRMVDAADVVLLSYGNTLFAHDRIVTVGLAEVLGAAAAAGKVMAGGSAGAILSFDGGHSDSMDPASFKRPPAGSHLCPQYDWQYIRAPGLGVVPGLICPHHDTRRRDGLYRADDFAKMVQEHAGERAIAIDEAAAVVIEGDSYRVLAKPSASGSVGTDGSFVYDKKGRAGVWKYTATAGETPTRSPVPESGLLTSLLEPASVLLDDPLLPEARKLNPDTGPQPKA